MLLLQSFWVTSQDILITNFSSLGFVSAGEARSRPSAGDGLGLVSLSELRLVSIPVFCELFTHARSARNTSNYNNVYFPANYATLRLITKRVTRIFRQRLHFRCRCIMCAQMLFGLHALMCVYGNKNIVVKE